MSWFKSKKKKNESEVICPSTEVSSEYKRPNLPIPNQPMDFTRYSREKNINMIPEEDFNALVLETFETMCQALRCTYGPYGSQVMISEMSDNSTTKDGFKTVESLHFSNPYQRLVYLTIKKICERVNSNVGDGTTTCILLANELYKRLRELCITPDDKRNMFNYLNKVEKYLLSDSSEFDKENNLITPLNKDNFNSIIGVASNYDDEMMNILSKAFDPKFDENGNVTSIRSIITNQKTDSSKMGVDMYTIDYLPGDYRISISMAEDFALALAGKSKMRIILYNHKFNHSDWMNLYKDYDRETPTLVIARSYTKEFMDEDYLTYLKQMALVKKDATMFFACTTSYHAKTDIEDLAAILKTEDHPLNAAYTIKHEELPEAIVSVYDEKCLCFYDLKEPPKDYIKQLEADLRNDETLTPAGRKEYEKRISDLRFEHEDTLVTVTCESYLESKFIADKIDDCVHIIESAFDFGTVPNSFQYGVRRILDFKDHNKDDEKFEQVLEVFYTSLRKMVEIIYTSKYGSDFNLEDYNTLICALDTYYVSYDVIKDDMSTSSKFCTSTQYDLEVLRASISIVKYLLTTKAFIFDAGLTPKQLPNGYIPQ